MVLWDFKAAWNVWDKTCCAVLVFSALQELSPMGLWPDRQRTEGRLPSAPFCCRASLAIGEVCVQVKFALWRCLLLWDCSVLMEGLDRTGNRDRFYHCPHPMSHQPHVMLTFGLSFLLIMTFSMLYFFKIENISHRSPYWFYAKFSSRMYSSSTNLAWFTLWEKGSQNLLSFLAKLTLSWHIIFFGTIWEISHQVENGSFCTFWCLGCGPLTWGEPITGEICPCHRHRRNI